MSLLDIAAGAAIALVATMSVVGDRAITLQEGIVMVLLLSA